MSCPPTAGRATTPTPSPAGSASGSDPTNRRSHPRTPTAGGRTRPCGKERDDGDDQVDDDQDAARPAAGVEDPPGPLPRRPGAPPPPTLRRRPDARRAAHGRGRWRLLGLLEEPRQ